MMADATALRQTLLQTENNLPSIQSASRLMMRFYDTPSGADLAVSEWRSVLQSCSTSQMLPLLYVANEVLQTSKRNRGNKFLEAFSPVLGSSLIHICNADRGLVEKVRRTVKVWGDRRVFSMRFVMDILAGLDSYRGGVDIAAVSQPSPALNLPKPEPNASFTNGSNSPGSNSDESDDEEDLFGDPSSKLLDVDLKVDGKALSAAVKSVPSPEFGAGAKRRRSSATAPTKAPNRPAPKKPKALSNQSFLDMFQSISSLNDKYKSSLSVLTSIPESFLTSADVDELVGDELTDMYKKVCETHRKVRKERRVIYNVAAERRSREKESKRYIAWLKKLVNVDDEDLAFAERIEEKLDLLTVCHDEAKALRDTRREEEARKVAEEEAAAQQEAEEEERRRMLEDVKKQAEAKPGMVWNPQLREYQDLHDPTQESWRD